MAMMMTIIGIIILITTVEYCIDSTDSERGSLRHATFGIKCTPIFNNKNVILYVSFKLRKKTQHQSALASAFSKQYRTLIK